MDRDVSPKFRLDEVLRVGLKHLGFKSCFPIEVEGVERANFDKEIGEDAAESSDDAFESADEFSDSDFEDGDEIPEVLRLPYERWQAAKLNARARRQERDIQARARYRQQLKRSDGAPFSARLYAFLTRIKDEYKEQLRRSKLQESYDMKQAERAWDDARAEAGFA